VHLIKKQLTNSKHPLHALMKVFKKRFYKENMSLLQKTHEEQIDSDSSMLLSPISNNNFLNASTANQSMLLSHSDLQIEREHQPRQLSVNS
jgi:hypothetical protein